MFDRVLIANRGEIAVRVIRTLRRLGIGSVAVYSDADRDALHVRLADDAIRLGRTAFDSYLSVERIVEAARDSGASALHPGYGFLSENAGLAERCAAAGIVFVGPPPVAIDAMGDKIRAKRTAAAAGVRTVPGSDGVGLSDDQLYEAALAIGFPVLIKPSAGGGGKGMRLVDDEPALAGAIASARREASNVFGDDTLFIERFVENPRHIEVQVLADAHGNVVHLGERECSLQRRHQKIVEEAPSPLLTDEQRQALGAQAVAAARSCGYVNAGTVEFIASGTNPDEVFFMEMNTRLQVEHPVTELVWGIDLVEWQLRVAAGQPLGFTQDDLAGRGHAIEARVYAEDPRHGFLPTGGTVVALDEPRGEGVRVDSGLVTGSVVGSEFDPLLAKVIAWGSDRAQARGRLVRALGETTILGVTTNTGFLRGLLQHPLVASGQLDTGLVDRELDAFVEHRPPPSVVVAAALSGVVEDGAAGAWGLRTGWRIGGPSRLRWSATLDGEPIVAELQRHGEGWSLAAANAAADAAPRAHRVERAGRSVWVADDGEVWHFVEPEPTTADQATGALGGGTVTSPMPGTVVLVAVAVGDHVEEGQPLVVVEAMKMEHTIRAAAGGVVVELPVATGDKVVLGQELVRIEPTCLDKGEE